MRKDAFIAIVAIAIWVTTAWFIPSKGWAQDNIPIGTVPLFPPVASSGGDEGEVNESLVQFNLSMIEISRDVHAEGVGGRLAVRSGLFVTVSDQIPQSIQLPVQMFGESVLGSFDDPETGVTFSAIEGTEEGLLEIPFGNDLASGLASITTGEMVAEGTSVSAEVLSVRISVGAFDLENESQVGGSASVEFAGQIVPEVFLIGVLSQSTAEIASLWEESGELTDGLVLVDILASTIIDAGFIGQFDGIPSLEITTSNSWRTSDTENEVRVFGITTPGNAVLLGGEDYISSSEDGLDAFLFSDISELSRAAIVLVKTQSIEDVHLETAIPNTPNSLPDELPTSVAPSIVSSVAPSVESNTVVDKEKIESDSRALQRFLLIGAVVLIVIFVVVRISAVRRNRV